MAEPLTRADASARRAGPPLRPTGTAVESARLPDGVRIQPRQFRFQGLDSVPQHWFGGNPILTHMENAFSILIPPGERFFIQSVKNFEGRTADPELKEMIRAFIAQEGHHSRAHVELNASFARHGIDIDREVAYAEEVIARLQRVLPKKMQLGATAFFEHLTAVGAGMLFVEPFVAEMMHPELARFWRWHAAEELEHKAVAFDLLREVGGGYLLRVFSAIAALALLARPFDRIVRRMIRQDPTPVTPEMKRQMKDVNRRIMWPQIKMILRYFRPGFHPWDAADERYLAEWYASGEGA